MHKLFLLLFSVTALTCLAEPDNVRDIMSDSEEYDSIPVEKPTQQKSEAATDYAVSVLKQKSDPDTALKNLFSALEKDPSSRVLASKVTVLLTKKTYDQYMPRLLELAEKHPENPALSFYSGVWLLMKNKAEDSKVLLWKTLEYALKQKPPYQDKYLFDIDYLLDLLVRIERKPYEDNETEELIEKILESPTFAGRFRVLQCATLFYLKKSADASDKKPFLLGWLIRSDKEKAEKMYSVLFEKQINLSGKVKDPDLDLTPGFFADLRSGKRQKDLDRYLKTLIDSYPENKDVFTIAADEYTLRGDFRTAKKFCFLEFKASRGNLSIRSMLRSAEVLTVSGNYKAAALLLENCVRNGVRDQVILERLCRIYHELKNHKRALAIANSMKDSRTAFALRGVSSFALKDYKNTVGNLEKVLSSLNPESKEYRIIASVLASAAENMKDHKRFDEIQLNLLKKYPDDPELLNSVGYTWTVRGVKLDEAEKMLRKAIKLMADKPNAAVMDSLAWNLYKRGKYQEAQNWIIKAVASSPEPLGTILDHAGDIFLKCGEKESAVKFWTKAIQNPDEEMDPKAVQKKLDEFKKENKGI